VSTTTLWDALAEFYDLEALDAMVSAADARQGITHEGAPHLPPISPPLLLLAVGTGFLS
jgi:hypothetical protein